MSIMWQIVVIFLVAFACFILGFLTGGYCSGTKNGIGFYCGSCLYFDENECELYGNMNSTTKACSEFKYFKCSNECDTCRNCETKHAAVELSGIRFKCDDYK